jgi:Putative adhesin
MTTTTPDPRGVGGPVASAAPAPYAGPPPLPVQPGRRLSPDPGEDRRWRRAVTLVGGAFLVVLLLSLAGLTTANLLTARSFSEVPATVELGTPTSLAVTSDVADTRILQSAEVDQVTIALVDGDATSLPPDGTEARARIDRSGNAQAPAIDVRQPEGHGAVPWLDERRDVLILVPEGHELALDLSTSVGDIRADGEFSALDVSTEVGEVQLAPVTAPDGLQVTSELGGIEIELAGQAPSTVSATSSVGDIDLLLPSDAGGAVTATSELGDVQVAAPGSGRWTVDAQAELGELAVDASLEGADGAALGTLTVSSEIGDVVVTR